MLKPTGTAKAIAINEVSRVPDNSGRIPKCLSVNNGVHWLSVKNSIIETSEKNLNASKESTRIIPRVIKMVTNALEKSIFSNTSSFIFRILKKCTIISAGAEITTVEQL